MQTDSTGITCCDAAAKLVQATVECNEAKEVCAAATAVLKTATAQIGKLEAARLRDKDEVTTLSHSEKILQEQLEKKEKEALEADANAKLEIKSRDQRIIELLKTVRVLEENLCDRKISNGQTPTASKLSLFLRIEYDREYQA